MDIYALMDFTRKNLPSKLEGFIDDWQWNDRSFQFAVLDKQGNASDPYRFIYKDDEEFYGSAEEQVLEWIQEVFYEEN